MTGIKIMGASRERAQAEERDMADAVQAERAAKEKTKRARSRRKAGEKTTEPSGKGSAPSEQEPDRKPKPASAKREPAKASEKAPAKAASTRPRKPLFVAFGKALIAGILEESPPIPLRYLLLKLAIPHCKGAPILLLRVVHALKHRVGRRLHNGHPRFVVRHNYTVLPKLAPPHKMWIVQPPERVLQRMKSFEIPIEESHGKRYSIKDSDTFDAVY